MPYSLLYQTDVRIIIAVIFLLTLIMTFVGHKFGLRVSTSKDVDKNSSTILQTGLYGLLAFLLGFTFNMATSRFEKSRAIITDEANCIGTAILRSDLYTEPERTALRIDFKEYLEGRLTYFSSGITLEARNAAGERFRSAGDRLWSRVTRLSQDQALLVESNQMVPALNAMFDIGTIREVNSKSMVPDQIMYMLFILALASAFLIGFTTKKFGAKSKILVVANALLTTMVIAIILDLDRPKRGMITTFAADMAMLDLRKLLE